MLGLLVLSAVAYAVARAIHRERRVYQLLCRAVESAQAPGEPVFVRGRLTVRALRSMGSPELKHQIVAACGPTLSRPEWDRGEVLLIATPGDPLLHGLQAKGFFIVPAMWEPPRSSAGWPGSTVRIFFVAAPRLNGTHEFLRP